MVGSAYAWYKWLMRNNYTHDRFSFVEVLQKRFGTDLYNNPQDTLKELKQTGSVAEYQDQFESLSTRVTGLSENWLISLFITGLNDYLKYQLHLAKPSSYPKTVAMAKLHEQNFLALQRTLKPRFNTPSTSFSRPRFPPRPQPNMV